MFGGLLRTTRRIAVRVLHQHSASSQPGSVLIAVPSQLGHPNCTVPHPGVARPGARCSSGHNAKSIAVLERRCGTAAPAPVSGAAAAALVRPNATNAGHDKGRQVQPTRAAGNKAPALRARDQSRISTRRQNLECPEPASMCVQQRPCASTPLQKARVEVMLPSPRKKILVAWSSYMCNRQTITL